MTPLSPAGLDAPIFILDAYDVVQLRGGGLEHLALLQRVDAVAAACRHAEALPGPRHMLDQGAPVVLEVELHSPVENVECLVFTVVVLEGKPLALVDVEDLAGVPVGVRPEQLETPRLQDLVCCHS